MKYKFRRNWRGKYILQVQRHGLDDLNGSGYYDKYTFYTDATDEDMAEFYKEKMECLNT